MFATPMDQNPYQKMMSLHNRNSSAVSDMGQADQLAPPTINIEPAPVSRQASFEPENNNVQDALSPPTSKLLSGPNSGTD